MEKRKLSDRLTVQHFFLYLIFVMCFVLGLFVFCVVGLFVDEFAYFFFGVLFGKTIKTLKHTYNTQGMVP